MQIARTVGRCITLALAAAIAIATFDAAHAASKKRHPAASTRHPHPPASSSSSTGAATAAPPYDPGVYK